MPRRLSVSVYLIQHVANPRRHESKNVGVIVSDSKYVAYVLVDPSAEKIPRFHRAVADIVSPDDTYPAWFVYWKRTLKLGHKVPKK